MMTSTDEIMDLIYFPPLLQSYGFSDLHELRIHLLSSEV